MQRSDAHSTVWTLACEATLCATEADALPTSEVLALAVYIISGSEAAAARAFSRRGLLATQPAAARRPDTDFRSVGHAEDELEASASGSALSGSGQGDAAARPRRETFVTVVRAPMQK